MKQRDIEEWQPPFHEVLPIKVPNIRTLCFSRCHFTERFNKDRSLSNFSKLRFLKSLQLIRCRFVAVSIPEFLHLGFPFITSLVLIRTSVGPAVALIDSDHHMADNALLRRPAQVLPALTSLTQIISLSRLSLSAHHWLIPFHSRHTLRHLVLRIDSYISRIVTSSVDTYAMKLFFREVGSTLEHLQLSWSRPVGVGDQLLPWVISNVDLSALSILKSLHIHYEITPFIFPLLMGLPQPHRHQIKTIIWVISATRLVAADYQPLDEHLALPNYPSLESVKLFVRHCPVSSSDAVASKMKSLFPRATARGVVQLVVLREPVSKA